MHVATGIANRIACLTTGRTRVFQGMSIGHKLDCCNIGSKLLLTSSRQAVLHDHNGRMRQLVNLGNNEPVFSKTRPFFSITADSAEDTMCSGSRLVLT